MAIMGEPKIKALLDTMSGPIQDPEKMKQTAQTIQSSPELAYKFNKLRVAGVFGPGPGGESGGGTSKARGGAGKGGKASCPAGR